MQEEASLEGYIVTSKGREILEHVADALELEEAHRAWTITGPYGGGKSAFALFLALLLRNDQTAIAKLAGEDPALAQRFNTALEGPYCPILVAGARESLSKALLRGLAGSLRRFSKGFGRKRGRPSRKIRALRETLDQLALEADQAVVGNEPTAALDLFERASEAVSLGAGGGLIIMVDELGKLLEYAALHPEGGDLFILQQLAERAARAPVSVSDEVTRSAPLLLFTILHQAFERYAGRLNQTQRDEWQKIQGRFADIAFIEPISETLRLLSQAICLDDPTPLSEQAKGVAAAFVPYAVARGTTDPDWIRDQLYNSWPLHPSVSLLVGPLFRRLAQNERSLFAFLASGEPHSFLDVVEGKDTEQADLFESTHSSIVYRLDHLYDYLVTNLGATLFSERMNRLWAETEAALASLRDPDPLQIRLVKHIALLGFAGQLAGLAPTPEVLTLTADTDAAQVRKALNALRNARVVTHRLFQNEYRVWQGSDFDLEAELAKARTAVPLRTPLADLLARTVPPTPVLARRHSYRTGTSRVFEVVYASDETWRSALEKPCTKTDGRIVYVLPEHDDTIALSRSIQEAVSDRLTLVAIPDGVAALRVVVRDLACLDWVRSNSDDLEGDEAARKEVGMQRAALAAEVERRLTTLLVADQSGQNPCVWITPTGTFRLKSERSLQQKLSLVCDAVFAHAPEVWNELLNRRKPSSSAVRGLKLLIGAMLEHDDEDRLGIEGTPAEYGMYASVLEATGIHRRDEDGRWYFGRPDPASRPGCVAVWDAIAKILREAQGQPVPIHVFYDTLTAPPYGVRPGLIPVFLFAFYKHAEDEIAFYESETFVRDLSFETMERLLKSQEKRQDTFTMQWVEIDGARAETLKVLAPFLGLPASIDKPLPIAIRLLRRIHQLPSYVRTTASLSDLTLAVREALQRATDPKKLLFEDLPVACGTGSFLSDTQDASKRIEEFSSCLQEALRELSGAYDVLLVDLENRFAAAFSLQKQHTDDRRREFAERATALLPLASDLAFKAFLVRASDEILDTRSWFESLAALLAKRSPAQWSDEDHKRYRIALRRTAESFFKLEPLAFDLESGEETGPTQPGVAEALHPRNEPDPRQSVRRVRLFVKVLSDMEEDGIIHIHQEDDALVTALYDELVAVLRGVNANTDVKLAALSKLTAELLSQRKPTFSDEASN
ncbi:MAG: hypothetical protein AAGI08_00420 [Bacteroidota bacterium]